MSDEPLNNEQIKPSSPLPINTTDSEPSNMPLEAPESLTNADIPVSLNNANPTPNEPEVISPEPEPSPETLENQTSFEPQTSQTAQIPVNEPFGNTQDKPLVFSQPKTSLARELLVKARNAIQFRKRKKLDKIMGLFLKKQKITNDEVREFLHVSDATAERYLNTLEKENRIKQVGKTGHAVSYSRI